MKMDVGLAYQGDTQIELIHVTNGAYSPYFNSEGEPLTGLHHLAWLVDDLDATVEAATSDGLKLVYRPENLGTVREARRGPALELSGEFL